jgi:NAD(P)-dependent dehydrogenase (short-subunit alcohol dehydrogenase family)
MKVAIIGHTQGIGQAFANECLTREIEWVGFSRSTGHDITDAKNQRSIVAAVADCDIIINNAHQDFHQVELFNRLWAEYHQHEKIIVNVSTAVTHMRSGADGPQHTKGRAHYAAEKSGLDLATVWARSEKSARCRILSLKPGLTDTPRVAADRPGAPRINACSMSRFVLSSLLDKNFIVKELTISPRKNNA